MKFRCKLKLLLLMTIFSCLSIFINCVKNLPRRRPMPSQSSKDPFSALGIPDLNPKALLKELDGKKHDKKPYAQLKTIEDLPKFLANSNLNEEDGIRILTKFLIQDDITLKKYGVVYDQTSFDGLPESEKIAPPGSNERLVQRARSAANIWFKEKMKNSEYDAYGAEDIVDEVVPNWRIYKVLLIGKKGESTFVKVCLPLDESETALCSDQDEPCGERTKYVEKEKARNEDYIQKIKSNNFFGKKPKMDMVKLLPGEKMIYKEKNHTIILDSHSQQQRYGNDGVFNPPNLNSGSTNNKILKSFKNKRRGKIQQQLPQFVNTGTPMQNNMQGNSNNMMGVNMNNMNLENPVGIGMNNMNNMNNMMGMMNMNNFMGMNNNMGVNGMNMNMNNMNNMSNLENLALNNGSNQVNTNHKPATAAPQPSPNFSFKQKPALNNMNGISYMNQNQMNNFNPNLPPNNNSNMMPKDYMEMKNQYMKMMQSLKEKEMKLQLQNQQLSQLMTVNSPKAQTRKNKQINPTQNMNMMNMNPIPNPQQMPNMQQMSNMQMSNIPNMANTPQMANMNPMYNQMMMANPQMQMMNPMMGQINNNMNNMNKMNGNFNKGGNNKFLPNM